MAEVKKEKVGNATSRNKETDEKASSSIEPRNVPET
jgi:hypothetical protein